VLDSAIAGGAAPGGVIAVSYRGSRYLYGAGRLGLDDPRPPDGHTIYDLASLTKVIATTTLAMIAVSEDKLDLDAPVRRYLPSFQGSRKDRVTVRHLLTHSSGLPADRRLWLQSPNADSALRLVYATPLDTLPGIRMVYSDLGAILLGEIVEQVFRGRLDRLAASRIFRPLRMGSTRFRPGPKLFPRIAATEYDSAWRKRMVRGEVHDEKAAWLGGVAGHAGLFGSAVDLLGFGEWLIKTAGRLDGRTASDSGTSRSSLPTGRPAVLPSVARDFTRRQDLPAGSSRALGWDTPSGTNSAGQFLDPTGFGHTGFTGTSMWIDPSRELVVVLLTNRIHPTRNNPRIGPLRVLVSDLVVTLLERSASNGTTSRARRSPRRRTGRRRRARSGGGAAAPS
jgi:CubicO group peptidase (beta-lactamase class C family)